MILFAWRRLPPPGFIGGAEISEGAVARSLAATGHPVTFVGSTTSPRHPGRSRMAWLLELLDHHGVTPNRDRWGNLHYRWGGIDCHAVDQEQLVRTVRRLADGAQLIWTSQEDCPSIRQAASELPAATYAHSVSDVGLLSAQLDARWVFAPSYFVQDVIRDQFGLAPYLLRPPLAPVAARSGLVGRNQVLFVNPIRAKGVGTACEIARRMPTTRFVFVEAWGPAEPDLELPPNVTLLPRLPTLTPLYQRARLLLVPSVVDDACPRVILEAGAHGVPVLGSDRGGIPELIANKANVLGVDDYNAWTARANHLLASPPEWAAAQHAQNALVGALREEPAQRLAQIGFPAPGVRR
jgi:glycosyltransferase involved in cell wall biosynthesis